MKKLFRNLLLIIILSISTVCSADTKQILQTNISKAEKRISTALRDVTTSLDKIKSAQKWEAKNWTEIDIAMQNFKSVSNNEYSTIDFNIDQLLKIDPGINISISDETPDFSYMLLELKAANQDLRKRYDKINDIKNSMQEGTKQVKEEMKQRTNLEAEKMFRDAIGTVGSKDIKDYAENVTVNFFNKILGSVNLIYSGIKVTFGLYYYSAEMKAQVKSINNYAQVTQWFNRFQAKVATDISLSDQGIQMLEKWQKDADDIKDNANRVRAKVKAYIESSRENQKSREDIKYEKNIKDISKIKIKSQDFWPLKEEKILDSSSFLSDAESILNSISSAVDQAMNGGDPDAIWSVINEKGKKLWEKRQKAQKVYIKAKEVYDEAKSEYKRQFDDLENQRVEALNRLPSGHDARLHDDINKKYYAQINALVSIAISPARKFQEADIEVQRLRRVSSTVSTGSEILFRKLRNYLRSTSAIFNETYLSHRDKFDSNIYEVRGLFMRINTHISNYDNKSLSTKSSILDKYSFGETTQTIQYMLMDRIYSLKNSKKEIKTLLPKFQSKLGETKSKANKAKEELLELLGKDAVLLVSEYSVRSLNFPNPSVIGTDFPKWTRTNDERASEISSWEQSIKDEFKIGKYDVDKAKSLNFNTPIAQYEKNISIVQNWQDRIDVYINKNETSLYYFSKVMKIHKLTSMNKTPRETLLVEMSQAAWRSLNTNLDLNLKSKTSNTKTMLPREKLVLLNSTIYKQAQEVLKYYISKNIYNANKEDFKALELSWTELKPLYKEFDTLSNQEWSKMNQFNRDKFFNLVKPTEQAFVQVPISIRSKVQVIHNHMMSQYYWLKEYLYLKQTNIRPIIAKDSTYTTINTWIADYKVKKQAQDESNKKADIAAKKQRLDEEKKKKQLELQRIKEREQEEATINSEIQNTQSIETLYSEFVQNYSNRELSGLMSLIADDWESSSDGTTLMDLEETLENSFSIFDEVACNIYSLNITKIGKNRYRVNYVINIKGFIYDDDIEHNEKSSVTEEIVFINGSPKIFKTLSGKYWNRR